MKIYTFFYYDSLHKFESDKMSEFVVTASRFSTAFKAFHLFVVQSCFLFFTFLNTYKVEAVGVSYRTLPSSAYKSLDCLRKLPKD